MHKTLILLGSNEGNRFDYLRSAAQALEQSIGAIQKSSQFYESEPWEFNADTDFLNQALLLTTELQPLPLLLAAQAIETELGRTRKNGEQRYVSRCIDIDVLLYDNCTIALPQLQIPHPRMHLRRFALMPAAEIVPRWKHPQLNATIRRLLLQCPDTSRIKKWNN